MGKTYGMKLFILHYLLVILIHDYFLHYVSYVFERARVHAKSLQWCPTLCNPMDYGRPPSRLCLWDSPGKNTGVHCHALLQGMTQGWNLCILCLLHYQANLCILCLLHYQADFLPLAPPGKPCEMIYVCVCNCSVQDCMYVH